jgi:hypothetical protein
MFIIQSSVRTKRNEYDPQAIKPQLYLLAIKKYLLRLVIIIRQGEIYLIIRIQVSGKKKRFLSLKNKRYDRKNVMLKQPPVDLIKHSLKIIRVIKILIAVPTNQSQLNPTNLVFNI